MEYNGTTLSRLNARRSLVTLAAICIPLLAAMLVSGISGTGNFKLAQAFDAASAHAQSAHTAAMSGASPENCNVTANVSISITENGFNPSSITVNPGTRVTWTNNGTDRHRVRDVEHNLFDSDDLDPGQSFSYTFCNPGRVDYIDERDGFRGVVVVSGTPGTTTPQTTGTVQSTSTPAGATHTPTRVGTPGGTAQVNIFDDDGFDPPQISVGIGTTVRWTNYHDDEHTITSPGNFNSGDIDEGQSWSFTFSAPGTYAYFCAYHEEMQATVIVTCDNCTPTPAVTPTPVAGNVDVSILNFTFAPQNVTVAPGTTVRWINNDPYPHTATSPGNFDSGILNQGQSYQYTFNTPGTYSYFCAVHPGMTGTITVTGGGGGTATPGATNTAQATATRTPTRTNTPVVTGTVVNTNTPQATATQGNQANVTILNFAYAPQNLTVAAGTTVRWTNQDPYPHTATSPGNFDSGTLNQGQGWQYTFNTPGTFSYFCAVHPAMTGTITVTGSGATSTPTAVATGTAQATTTGTSTPIATGTAQATVTTTPTATAQATSTPSGPVNVNIRIYAFEPQNITVPAGTTVRWTNLDNDQHTVTSQTGLFDSGILTLNQTWQYTFNTPGTYSYFCAVHPMMIGTITVTGAPATATPIATATATATWAPGQRFSDVTPTDYFYAAVNWLVERGIISGYSDNTFRPYNNTTRGQVTKMVVLGEGWAVINPATPTFTDVQPDHPFYGYIETAVQQNVISGYADDTFRPYNNVTRGQIAKIIVLARGWALANPSAPTFADVPADSPFYGYVETAVEHAIISGYSDRTFRPGNNATRGQISKILHIALTSR